MLPEFGQWAVLTCPFLSLTSAMKRLYRLTRLPSMSFGHLKTPSRSSTVLPSMDPSFLQIGALVSSLPGLNLASHRVNLSQSGAICQRLISRLLEPGLKAILSSLCQLIESHLIAKTAFKRPTCPRALFRLYMETRSASHPLEATFSGFAQGSK
jgi:hypothetical protein